MTLDIESRSKTIRSAAAVGFDASSPVGDIVRFLSQSNKLSVDRIRLTFDRNGERIPLKTDKTLAENGFSGTKLQAKDLGPQIGWRTVYVIEYLGPILIHLFFYFNNWVFGYGSFEFSLVQKAAFWLLLAHFVKRELETIFLHKFSNATMPFKFIFKNCSHYWLLSGVLIAVFSYAPRQLEKSNAVTRVLFHVNEAGSFEVAVASAAIVFFEASNYVTHKNLASLRDKDPKNYAIPRGYGFDLVTCPNYFFEIMAFVAFTALVGNWSYALFIAVGGVQMYIWAVGKHKRLLKTFGDEYKKLNRKVLFPYVL